jgi:Na+:H+ antiporter, NhaA family
VVGTNRPSRRRVKSALREFLKSEATGGVVLMVAAAAALVLANSPFAPAYFEALKSYVGGLSVLHWINDGLMAVFFLLVGLEIKRELLDGHLSTWPRRILPGVAAAGGMVAPAVIYIALNSGNPEHLRGWAIPTATDIAFALGVLALLGRRVPVSLKVFLTALAIIDDLGAVAVIAAFYTADISLPWLSGVAAVLAILIALNLMSVARLPFYLVLGVALWYVEFRSGVHATLAGVALAFTIPIRTPSGQPSPLHRLEHQLHPWVAYGIVPLFGFANAGVPLGAVSLATLLAPVPLGIALGLFVGKQIGVFVTTWLTVRLGWADRPEGASWPQLYGVALICGIGFTMSLFIGLLAFPSSPQLQDAVKIGVLMGSLLSALAGAVVLLVAPRPGPPTSIPGAAALRQAA